MPEIFNICGVIDGETRTVSISALSRICGVSNHSISLQINRGLRGQRLIDTVYPTNGKNRIKSSWLSRKF